MGSNKMIKALYKSIFKLAQKFDKNVPAKALLYRLPPVAEQLFKSSSQLHFTLMMDKLIGRQRLFYHPTRLDQSFKAIVRKEFRNNKSKISLNSRLDVGFAMLRQLSTLWVNYDQEVQYILAVESITNGQDASITDSSDSDSGTDAKKSTKQKKKEDKEKQKKNKTKINVTAAPAIIQEGVILAAHPMVHGDLHRSLVLVVDHTEEFSYGVIINKARTQHTVTTGVSGLRLDGFYEAFGVSTCGVM
jgi:hypothetical protein